MKIAFADFIGWDFHAQSPDFIPMGGSHSAACHLARSLVRAGHEVILINRGSQPGIYDGVTCLSWPQVDDAQLGALNLDVLVCLMAAGVGVKMRNALGPKPLLILWTQHAHDQEDVAVLQEAAERDAYDGFVLVSGWQQLHFRRHFGIEPERTTVLRNAVAPAFANLFAEGESILERKAQPPVLAYTSTPFRGLELLLEVFPRIRQAVAGTRLQVFSSMRVYQVPSATDEASFGALYQRCREMEGVEYHGSLPQPELARALRDVTVLAYPNVFPETSCIAVMEALAAGCRVVTSRLGALPETGGSFARLLSVEDTREKYLEGFVDETIKVLRECVEDRNATEQSLRAQVTHMNQTATWPLRAAQWVEWLDALPRFASNLKGGSS